MKRRIGRLMGYADLARHGLALRRATDERAKATARRHLSVRMGRLHGLPQKIGQLLSISTDESLADCFKPLAEHSDPLPFEVVEQVLEQEWGRPVEQVLARVDPVGLAASLGQVHRAVRCDGREVAVKVQYPGIGEAVRQDLQALGWLSVPAGDPRRGFDLSAYRAEIQRGLEEELDYQHEAARQELYRRFARDVEGLVVPRVHDDLTTNKVLVSDWEDGETLDEASTWSPVARDDLAFILIRHFCQALFGEGHIHADPHAGNYRFRWSQGVASVVLYDFGSTLSLDRTDRLLLLRLIRSSSERSTDDPLSLFVSLGFREDLLEPLAEKLPALSAILLEPFSNPAKFDMDRWNLGARVEDVLGDDRWNFRISGPAHLVLLMRAFHGLVHQLGRLNQPVSWRLAAQPFLDRDAKEIDRLSLRQPAGRVPFSTLAKHLRVRVTEDGRTKVQLTFPARVVENLAELMDDDVLKRVLEHGIDLEERIRAVRRGAYRPQDVFALEDGRRTFRVWLE